MFLEKKVSCNNLSNLIVDQEYPLTLSPTITFIQNACFKFFLRAVYCFITCMDSEVETFPGTKNSNVTSLKSLFLFSITQSTLNIIMFTKYKSIFLKDDCTEDEKVIEVFSN